MGKIYIFGHKNPDTDSVTSAIALSYLKNIRNDRIILRKPYEDVSNVWHIFPIRANNRDELQKYLESNDIQTNIHYPTSPHKQGVYKEWENQKYPVTEEIHRTELSLPISPVMTDLEAKKVVEVINEWKAKI